MIVSSFVASYNYLRKSGSVSAISMNSPVLVFRIYFWSALKYFWNHSQSNSIMLKSRHMKNTFYWYIMVTEHYCHYG